METSIPVVPYMGGYGNNNNDGFGGGGIMGGLLLGSLLGNRGGLFGNGGGYGGGYGGPAASAVASEVVLSPTLNAIQTQIGTLSNTVNQNAVINEIEGVENSLDVMREGIARSFDQTQGLVASTAGNLANQIANLSTAQAAANFTTLQSINGLGRDVTAQANQNALQQLNSFNQLTTTTLQGFNGSAMQVQNTTNQIIAQGTALSSQLAECCCTLRETINRDGDETRALINANRMADLQDSLNQARLSASQSEQTAAIVAALGSNGNGNSVR